MRSFSKESKDLYQYYIREKECNSKKNEQSEFTEHERTLVDIISKDRENNINTIIDDLHTFYSNQDQNPILKVITGIILADHYINHWFNKEAEAVLDEIYSLGFDRSWKLYDAWIAHYLLLNTQCIIIKGQFKKARKLIREAREIFRELNEICGLAHSYTIEGKIDFRAGKVLGSSQCYEKSLEFFNKIDCKIGTAKTLNHIGNLLRYQGEYDRAIENYKQSISEYLEVGRYHMIPTISLNLYQLYQMMEHYEAARDQLELTLEIAKKTENYPKIVIAEILKGELLRYNNQIHESIDHLIRAFSFIKKYGSKQQHSLFYIQLGLSYAKLGQYKTGIIQLGHAINHLEDLENNHLLIHTTTVIGTIHLKTGEFEEANNCFQTALDLATASDWEIEKQWAKYHIARCHYYAGKLKMAQKQFRELLFEVKEKGNVPLEGRILIMMGDISRQQGNINHALEVYNSSLEKFKDFGNNKYIAIILTDMGKIYQLKEDYESAIQLYIESMNYLNNSQDLVAKAYTLFNLIQVLAPRNDPKIKYYFKSIQELSALVQDPQIKTMANIAESFILKEQKRGKSVYKAQEILTSILEDRVTDYELSIITLKTLCEMLINEYQVFRNREILEQIEEILEKAYEFGHIQETSPLILDVFILKCRLAFVNNNFSDVNKYLQQAEKIISSSGSDYLNHRLEMVKEEILLELDEMKAVLDQGEDLKKIHYEESVLDYIDTLLSDMREQSANIHVGEKITDREYLK